MKVAYQSDIGQAPSPRSIGYLLAPFGWAAEPLFTLAQMDLAALGHVFELNRPRMHAIALALAYTDGDSWRKSNQFLARHDK